MTLPIDFGQYLPLEGVVSNIGEVGELEFVEEDRVEVLLQKGIGDIECLQVDRPASPA